LSIKDNCVSREVSLLHPGTALRLNIFFGTDAQSWGNLQTHYDSEHACVAMAGVLAASCGVNGLTPTIPPMRRAPAAPC